MLINKKYCGFEQFTHYNNKQSYIVNNNNKTDIIIFINKNNINKFVFYSINTLLYKYFINSVKMILFIYFKIQYFKLIVLVLITNE